jgi:hypothetical protein
MRILSYNLCNLLSSRKNRNIVNSSNQNLSKDVIYIIPHILIEGALYECENQTSLLSKTETFCSVSCRIE